jgi:putative membrane protein
MVEEYFFLLIDYINTAGFLETRASFGIDIIVTFLALLPILSGISIFFAIRKKLKLHQFTQFLLFFLSLISLILFAYNVYYQEGFDLLLEESSINGVMALIILVLHIVISMISLTLWIFALIYALSDKKRMALPGLYSVSHAQAGKRVFKGIVLISLSSIGIYWVLFVA